MAAPLRFGGRTTPAKMTRRGDTPPAVAEPMTAGLTGRRSGARGDGSRLGASRVGAGPGGSPASPDLSV